MARQKQSPDGLPSSVWQRAARDADITLELPGGVPMFFRRIPAGNFLMGSRGYYAREEPIHPVRMTRDFYLGTFPVTQEQYQAVAEVCAEIEDSDPSNLKDPSRPVERVNWHEASAFCNWLTEQNDLPTGFEARLPTEAQWEYACRAGSETEYYCGDGEEVLTEIGWEWCRSAFRFGYDGADDRSGRDGFRVCLVRSPAAGSGAEEEREQ